GDDAGTYFVVDESSAGLAVYEQGDRHAPAALPAARPVRAARFHRADAVAALFGHEAGLLDRFHRRLPQSGRTAQLLLGRIDRTAFAFPAPLVAVLGRDMRHHLVHRHEPLRGAAEDHLGLGAPAMRVGVM